MRGEGSSYLGFNQSRLAAEFHLPWDSVGTRRSKKDKGTSLLRNHVGANVARLRDQHPKYRELPNPTARNEALAKDADVSPSQIHRMVNGQLGASIDIIERVAAALNVRPQDLLTPYFVLQPIQAAKDLPQPREIQRRRGT